MLGYINTPSAYNLQEASVTYQLNRNEPDRKIFLTASPFNWLDANLFYVDVTKKEYGSGFRQSYKDKGLSFKITLGQMFNHTVAIGINDLAGTGYYNSEYIVLSNKLNRLNYTIGLGWGNFSNGLQVKNPLIRIDPSFRNRSKLIKDRGGSIDPANLFSGQNASIFFGTSYSINPNNKIFFELDPTILDGKINYPEKKSDFNLGHELKYGNFRLKSSFIRGNSFQFDLSFSENFLDFDSSPKKYKRKISSYPELQDVLDKNLIGLKSVIVDDSQIEINVRHNAYEDVHKASDLVFFHARQLEGNHETVIISNYLHGAKLSSNSHPAEYNYASRNQKIGKLSANSQTLEYKVIDQYPIISNSIGLNLRNFIASREGFYHGGLLLENSSEIIFAENIFILSNLKYSIYDNFDELYIPPVDTYPNQVRSDNKKYLNNLNNGVTVGRLELNYFKGFSKKHFFRLSAGIFEEMFGGAGIEYLYFPEKSLISLGIESFYLKKRDYDMRFKFLDYENYITRGHIEITEPQTMISMNLSFGEYIAGDKGYTLRLSRSFNNGIEFAAFYSDTNVPDELYGEGSFDKGVYVRIPFPTLLGGKSLGEFEWHPLTKDPAAMLIKSVNLRKETHKYRF